MSAPRFQKAIVNGAGTKVILTYSETLSSTTASKDDFTITVDGSAVSISSVAVSGSTIELTLDSQVNHATPVKVSYGDPTSGNDTNAIQDTVSNDASSLTNRDARNLRGFSTYAENTQSFHGATHQEHRNLRAFAALKDDGSVVTWGNARDGGDSSSVSSSLSSGVSQIFSNYRAFAALKDDGSVVTWGDSNHGGNSLSLIHI